MPSLKMPFLSLLKLVRQGLRLGRSKHDKVKVTIIVEADPQPKTDLIASDNIMALQLADSPGTCATVTCADDSAIQLPKTFKDVATMTPQNAPANLTLDVLKEKQKAIPKQGASTDVAGGPSAVWVQDGTNVATSPPQVGPPPQKKEGVAPKGPASHYNRRTTLELSHLRKPPVGTKIRGSSGTNYTLDRELSRGAFGTVLLARDTTNNEDVAIKVYEKRKLMDTSIAPVGAHVDQSLHRYGHLSQLDVRYEMDSLERAMQTGSPFVGRAIELFQDQEWFYLVMEKYENTLYSIMPHYRDGANAVGLRVPTNGSAFTPEKMRRYAAEILCGLRSLHEFNCFHLDLKEDNVMIDSKDHIKIIDFGLAHHGSGLVSGHYDRLDWMAPEVCNANFAAGAADAYSFGILLETMNKRLPMIHHDTDVLDLIHRLTVRDADKRMSLGEAVKHPYFAKHLLFWGKAVIELPGAPHNSELALTRAVEDYSRTIAQEALRTYRLRIRTHETEIYRTA